MQDNNSLILDKEDLYKSDFNIEEITEKFAIAARIGRDSITDLVKSFAGWGKPLVIEKLELIPGLINNIEFYRNNEYNLPQNRKQQRDQRFRPKMVRHFELNPKKNYL